MDINTTSNPKVELAITLCYNTYGVNANSTIKLAITIEIVYHSAILANLIFKLTTVAIDINS